MHQQAYDWVVKFGTDEVIRVLDIGGRNINGTAMDHFPNAYKTVLDIAPGPGVNIVADAAAWRPNSHFDVVTCCEVFEHTQVWPAICRTAYDALNPGGQFIVTTAGPGRARHSAVDGGRRMRRGEWYANVTEDQLATVLDNCGFVEVVTDTLGEDTRAWARK